MTTRCPNCGHYRTRVVGGRGCLLRIYRTVGRLVLLIGFVELAAGIVVGALTGAWADPRVAAHLAGTLLLICAGRAPHWLGHAGSRHALYCANCAYTWREAA